MKRYIKTSTVAISEDELAIEEFGSNNPSVGCSYIVPDGTFVNIYPKLDIHEDLCDQVENELGIELEYKDEEYFIREFGWVRLRSDPNMMIVELPSNNPTNSQWYSLEDWLYFCEQRYGRPVKLDISILDDARNVNVQYQFMQEYFTEDILKLMKRYYSSGKLYS